MRYLRPTLALLALPSTILAVSLSDFTPRVSDLPSTCEAIYKQTISGCSASDFSSSSCSKGCVQALKAFTSKVKSACGNEDIGGRNIITTFLSGGGPAGLCSNADAVLGGSSESSVATSSAATKSAATTSKAASSSSASSSSAPSTSSSDSTFSSSTTTSSAVLSGTATATSLASSTSASDTASSSGILVDTSTAPTITATSTSSPSGSSQTNMNDNSGGGSPFDSEGNMNSLASLTTSCSITTMLLATGSILFAMLR